MRAGRAIAATRRPVRAEITAALPSTVVTRKRGRRVEIETATVWACRPAAARAAGRCAQPLSSATAAARTPSEAMGEEARREPARGLRVQRRDLVRTTFQTPRRPEG